MSRTIRHQLIKRLQAELPRGAPFGLATLESFGVSPQLAARYVEGGWLVRLAHGVYAFPNDDFDVNGALRFLQGQVAGLHVGGKSALALQGGTPQPGVVGHPCSLGRCPFRHTYLVHRAVPGALCRGQALRLARRYSRRKDSAHSPQDSPRACR
ncbi:AbiEi antitoxin N-terminal domain-containing protein [Xanthomonas arboricola pv. pruni]|uniref:AbiEi antitoxin N-terminal domain-containing protein n=1 Tax=Xanthomonas arboricola TaxID=56448 RepID=UPI001F2AC3C5|nr:AbiEi antitoxin N-terminal domain-containing protein [Xanthomonas arboricola]UJO08973.1 AbiEi antitoxin N-terminal domain-containing protein [Xanthomonas arboricola pv. pruni]